MEWTGPYEFVHHNRSYYVCCSQEMPVPGSSQTCCRGDIVMWQKIRVGRVLGIAIAVTEQVEQLLVLEAGETRMVISMIPAELVTRVIHPDSAMWLKLLQVMLPETTEMSPRDASDLFLVRHPADPAEMRRLANQERQRLKLPPRSDQLEPQVVSTGQRNLQLNRELPSRPSGDPPR